jgi:hypothetical protein
MIYRVSAKKSLDFIVFSGSEECRYGLIISNCQSHNTTSLILNKSIRLYVSIAGEPKLLSVREPQNLGGNLNSCGRQETIDI